MDAKKILIIDDNPDSVGPTRFILERAGYTVEVCESAKEGIQKFARLRPHLVLLDILMPQINGLEVLYLLRNTFPGARQVPIVMLTVKSDANTVFQAKGFGATDYIVKSAEPDELLGKIRTILEEGIQ